MKHEVKHQELLCDDLVSCSCEGLMRRVADVEKQRDELLEALRGMMDAYMDLCDDSEPNYRSYEFRKSKWDAARAAIASVKGGES